MIKKLVSHLGEYKRAAVLTPLFAALEAMMVGKSTSITASRAAKSGVRTAARLYSPRCDTNFLII